ncbi:MAG TPA: molybdopterin molybdotransferase MoeA [Chitinophagaceae bacterium]|nr:molybdopterin molybdotransferase MoeA [Chitinophagaceae bacterium]
MIAVAEALEFILKQQRDYGIEEADLLQSTGRILATDIKADRDYPAFDRVMMDGIAINTRAFESNINEFVIQSIQAAGDEPAVLNGIQNCIEIMTGAVLPANCDAVVPYEELTIAGNTAIIKATSIKQFQNVHKKGSDGVQDTVLLNANTKMTAAHAGILASVGAGRVPVKRLPSTVVCSTGNELVEIDEQPLPHQLRMSNLYMLAALLKKDNITASLHHIPDDEAAMTSTLTALIAQHEVVILSGAVSKGKFDYLPGVLKSLGMRTIFHRIAQRPGKPMLFGECPNGTLIFGFPGNPMSTFVCYQVYFKAWLYQSQQYNAPLTIARLGKTVTFTPNLSYHLPVFLLNEGGLVKAIPVPGNNSGDIPSLAVVEGLVTLPPEKSIFEEGITVNVTLC